MIRFAFLAAGLVSLALSQSGAADEKDNPLSEPKKSIEHQLKLLKAGDVDKLKECFTKRQQERVTKEAVAKGQKNVDKMTIDDLVKDITMGTDKGMKTAKIKMKNGRTLTTLILTDGKWLSDTIWFN
jgi:hypothetical protein